MAENTSKESILTHTEDVYYESVRKNGSKIIYNPLPQYRNYRNWSEGIKNPMWRTQVILGQNATTPFEGYSYKYYSSPYDTKVENQLGPSASGLKWKTHYARGTQRFYPPGESYIESIINSIPTSQASSDALGRLVEDIREQHSAFTGSTTLAELTKTIAQIRNPAKALRKGVSDYLETIKRYGKRWSKAGRKAALDAVTGTYLEATYGWGPFLGEIDSIKNAISESYGEGLHKRKWAHGVGEATGLLYPTVKNYTSNYYATLGTPKVSRKQKYYVTVKYSSMLAYDVTGGQVQNLGFTPREWLPALWEVIPWSFVVDYFSNIGNIISGLSYVGSNVNFTNKTIRQVYIETYNWNGTFQNRNPWSYETGPPIITGTAGSSEFEGKRVRRSVYDGLLIPPLDFSLPGSGRRWLNLGALAVANRQALKSLVLRPPDRYY